MDISGTLLGQIQDLIAERTRFMRSYPGQVLNVDDSEARGRIKCAVPELGWFTDSEAPWCEPIYRGGNVCVPKTAEFVLVAFLGGNGSRPIWDGALGEVPVQCPAEHTQAKKRLLYSREGRYILHDETDDTLTIQGFGTVKLNGESVVEINGNTKSFVTHAELDSALQGGLATLNTQLSAIMSGASAAIAASGLWLTPLTLGGITLNISAAETQKVKTGG